jgi:uncharacterized membrane protein (DUF4010 family)
VGVLLLVISTRTLSAIWPALVAAGAVGALWVALAQRKEPARAEVDLGNPMELRPALVFAALLTGVVVASRYATGRFGSAGLYGLSAAAGLADVDAVVLTAADQAAQAAIAPTTAGAAVLIAVAANLVLKAAMALAVAGRPVGYRVLGAFATAAAAAVLAVAAV